MRIPVRTFTISNLQNHIHHINVLLYWTHQPTDSDSHYKLEKEGRPGPYAKRVLISNAT